MYLKISVLITLFFLFSFLFSQETDKQIDLYSGEWQLSVNDSVQGKIRLPYLNFTQNNFRIQKSFFLESDSTINSIHFQSDGFYGNALIYINKNLIYEQKNTTSPIQVSILKDYLNNGSDNQIEIIFKRNNSSQNNFPQFTQTFTPAYPLGVSRQIQLILKKEKPLDDFDYILKQNGDRWILTYSMNINRNFFSNLKSQGIRLLEKITFSEKETLTERLMNINPTSNQKIERSLSLKEKHLWSTENPVFLYFEFELKRYDVLLDKFSIRRAIKVPEINKERLFLNSEQMTVKGINYHANFIENTDKIVSDLKMIKKMGFNAVRFPNLIPSDNYFSVADTLGLLIFCDFPIKRYPSDLFDDALLQISRRSASMAISSLVQHPSFFAFGLGQEVNLNDPLVQKFFIILNDSIKLHPE